MSLELANRGEILAKIIAMVNRELPKKQAQVVLVFLEQFYANAPVEDLNYRSIDDLYGQLISLWSILYQRQAKECKIKVFNPQVEEDGWQSNHTIVEVVNDDMPFIVDSMRMEILRQGYGVHFSIHTGELKVKRNGKNEVVEIFPIDAEINKDTNLEAVIYFEIDKQTNPQALEELTNGIARVLVDVRMAVEDWAKMRARMQAIMENLRTNPPPLDKKDVEESLEFLRWLDDEHFTYLGARDYDLKDEGDEAALYVVPGSGLGILRNEEKAHKKRLLSSLPPIAQELAFSKNILVISKTNTKATVHRPVYTHYIGVKRYDNNGKLIGEHRFLGLYTSTVYNSHPKDIPFLRHKINMVLQNSKLSTRGHAGKELLDILATLPRDDLFQATTEELTELALGILHIQERRQVRLFVRQDAYRRFLSCLVYVPRGIFTTELSTTFEKILMQEFSGIEVSSATLFSESALVRVHYLIRTNPKRNIVIDVKKTEAKLAEAARSWRDELRENMYEHFGEEKGIELADKYLRGFPASYRDDYSPQVAVFDIEHMEKLSDENPMEMNFYHSAGSPTKDLNFKLFQSSNPIILSDVLPMLENMGLRVIDERPYEINLSDGSCIWIHVFSMTLVLNTELDIAAMREQVQDAFRQIWLGKAENDGFNKLVLGANLTWREAAVFRVYAKYLRQIGFTFNQSYIEATLAKNAGIARQLIDLFKLLFDPVSHLESTTAVFELTQQLNLALDAVANLDEDRILRRYLEVLHATLRTNFFQRDGKNKFKDWISIKLDPNKVADMPLPRPMFEVFVYSPSMEGVHLRAAKVARGGIRWSDRREDFRTEILGLMKAQQVKNAVIVPSGAKGGFVVKYIPSDATRDVVNDIVIKAYQAFICGLLDLTDNLMGGKVIPPQNTVRYDGDDTYLVVAADKGTATFSDIANQIALDYSYWLGDAFASGGSTGYDHKKIAITARGAWESVLRHFRTLGIDPDKQTFTVVGIGDMSGDVFGNGMLRSRQIKLVAAFNHEHIFIDPNPDPAISFAERERLFYLPRSSWADYNVDLISEGGGIFRRSVKVIKLTPQIKALLQVELDVMEPNNLIRAILCAPVDLLWNGGIGTYVKSSVERNIDVGDRSNDALRVNAKELRCRCVSEGGNLGFTQLGRVEYALNEGLIYTDFIDNSAGVDCSDHEVNCKILLNAVVASGDMTVKQRNKQLADMTDEVADLVLQDNHTQTRTISLAVVHSMNELDIYRRYLNELELTGKIDRALEFLPDNKVIAERRTLGFGLTSPEIAILLAYTKIILKADLLTTDVIVDPYLSQAVKAAFPKPLSEKYKEQMETHSLKPEIIATVLSNELVNDMGVVFLYRVQRETQASTDSIVRAYVIAARAYSLRSLISQADSDNLSVSAATRYEIMAMKIRLARRSARWFLKNSKEQLLDIENTIKIYQEGINKLNEVLPQILIGTQSEEYEQMKQHLEESNVPQKLAWEVASIRNQYSYLDIVAAARENKFDLIDTAKVYFAIGEFLEFSWLREMLNQQPVEKHWDALARGTLRDDLDAQHRKLTVTILQANSKVTDVQAMIDIWAKNNDDFIKRWQAMLTDLKAVTNPEYMMYSVVIRELIQLVRYQKTGIKKKLPANT